MPLTRPREVRAEPIEADRPGRREEAGGERGDELGPSRVFGRVLPGKPYRKFHSGTTRSRRTT